MRRPVAELRQLPAAARGGGAAPRIRLSMLAALVFAPLDIGWPTAGAAQSLATRADAFAPETLLVAPPRPAATDTDRATDTLVALVRPPADPAPAERRFVSRADSLQWVAARTAADRDSSLRVLVSLFDRQVLVLRGRDTLHVAPAAIATGDTLEYAGRTWIFTTPRGRRVVRAKHTNPVWTPPEWHYAEVARDYGLTLAHIPPGGGVRLKDGSRLVVRDSLVGLIAPGSRTVDYLPTDEEIVFDSTLYVPPYGTLNRRIAGELGRFRLDLGDGYLLHGTPDQGTIGAKVTHGCVRLRDEDIAWLYAFVPIGTPVYIY